VLKLSEKVDEGMPLAEGIAEARSGRRGVGRGLHSSTFRLNLSALCGMWVHAGVVEGVFRRCQGVIRIIRGCLGCISCQKRLRLS